VTPTCLLWAHILPLSTLLSNILSVGKQQAGCALTSSMGNGTMASFDLGIQGMQLRLHSLLGSEGSHTALASMSKAPFLHGLHCVSQPCNLLVQSRGTICHATSRVSDGYPTQLIPTQQKHTSYKRRPAPALNISNPCKAIQSS
jgi:hypothetical protein